MNIASSPWGKVQHSQLLADGIVLVSTARHGGIKLTATRNRQVHPALRQAGGWYEEDCDAEIVFWTFPDVCPNIDRQEVAEALHRWMPERAQAAGVPIPTTTTQKEG